MVTGFQSAVTVDVRLIVNPARVAIFKLIKIAIDLECFAGIEEEGDAQSIARHRILFDVQDDLTVRVHSFSDQRKAHEYRLKGVRT